MWYLCDVLFSIEICITTVILIYALQHQHLVVVFAFVQWPVHSTSTVFIQLPAIQIFESDDFRI